MALFLALGEPAADLNTNMLALLLITSDLTAVDPTLDDDPAKVWYFTVNVACPFLVQLPSIDMERAPEVVIGETVDVLEGLIVDVADDVDHGLELRAYGFAMLELVGEPPF